MTWPWHRKRPAPEPFSVIPAPFADMFHEWEAHQAKAAAEPQPGPDIIAAPLCAGCDHPTDVHSPGDARGGPGCWLCVCRAAG